MEQQSFSSFSDSISDRLHCAKNYYGAEILMKTNTCKICNNPLKTGKIYCSHKCYHQDFKKTIIITCLNCNKKRKVTPAIIKLKWGKFCSRECSFKFRKGAKHPNWKGNLVGYHALHNWIKKNKEKPKNCEKCKKEKRLDLTNISGKYLRDIHDYEYLCRSCHFKKDNVIRFLNKKGEI